MAGEDIVSLPTLKLLLIGDSAVGKSRYMAEQGRVGPGTRRGCTRGSRTHKRKGVEGVSPLLTSFLFLSSCSLLLRFTENQFQPYLNPTIGEHGWLAGCLRPALASGLPHIESPLRYLNGESRDGSSLPWNIFR